MAKPKFKSKQIALIAAIVLMAGLGVWYAKRAKSSPAAKKATPTATESKKVAETNTAKTDTTINKDAPAKTETSSSNNKVLYIVVNRPVANDTLKLADGIQLRSTITGATSGSCALSLVGPGGKVVSKTASMVAQTSYGSCSFDVASSELVAGDWNVALTASSGDASGKSNFKVTVQ